MKNILFLLVLLVSIVGCQKVDSPRDIQMSRQLITQSLEHINQGKIDEAIFNLEESIKKNPQDVESVLLLSQIQLTSNKFQEAVSILEQGARNFPDNEMVFYLLGLAELKAGNKAKALVAARRSCDLLGHRYQDGIIQESRAEAFMLYSKILESRN